MTVPLLSKSEPRWLSRSERSYPSIGPFVLEWMRSNLVHGEGDRLGEPFRPDPWFEDAVMRIYRYHPDTFRRVVRRATIGIAKGNAKTEYAAALALAELMGPTVPHAGLSDGAWPKLRQSPNVPLGAASYDQAGLCFGAAAVMVREGSLAPFCDVYEREIRLKEPAKGKLYRIAAEAGTQDGTLPTAFVADEVHEWKDRKSRVHLVVGNSLAKRAGGLEVNISTAGDPLTSELLFDLYEAGKRVATGEVVDDSYLFVWYEADPALRLEDPDELREAIRQANPAGWQDVERIAKRFEVDRIPEHEFRRYHLNQWVTAGDTWLPAGVWPALAAPRRLEPRTPIVVGFDQSFNNDSTAMFGCTIDGVYVFELGVWERPPNDDRWQISHGEVTARLEQAAELYDVRAIRVDPAPNPAFYDTWIERWGEDVVLALPNTRTRMVPATKRFYDAAVRDVLRHDGSVTLTRHIMNAVIKEVPGGYVLKKDHPNRKIDAAIAAVLAHEGAHEYREQSPGTTTVWYA